MSKYDFVLDMNSINSNSVILKNIKPNSIVLEIGCAHGRMTKYLKEVLNCEVTIIEKDYDPGLIAKQWSNKDYIGDTVGDIENNFLSNFLFDNSNVRYDYIIFADVLEHLYDPKKVLESIKPLLKVGGSIWISIPNIAHNSVIIDLLNNKFEYREIGLLDNTHIRFFTELSLHHMINSCGLSVNIKHNLFNTVTNTEFNNSYNDVPKEVSNYLLNRPSGEVYQFVWELKNI